MKHFLFPFLILLLPFTASGQGSKQLIHELETAAGDSAIIGAYHQLINYYRYINEDSALLYAKEGLVFAEKRKYLPGQGILLNALGQINERHGLLDLAKAQYEQARAMFVRIDHKKGIASTTNGLGVIAGKTGKYDEATRHFLKALQIFEAIKDKSGIVQTHIKLGVLNDHLGNPEEALTYYLKAEALNAELPSTNASLTLLNNIGIIYGKRNDIPTALKYFHKGLKESHAKGSTGVHIALLGSLGIAYEKSGMPDSARYFQEQALSKARENNLPEEEARAMVNIASLLRASNPQKSLRLLSQALAITERIQHLNLMTEVYESMINLHKEASQFEQALALSEKRQLLKDSLLSLEKSKEIANLHAVHELANQEREIGDLAAKNERSILQRNVMIAVALVAMAMIGIGWYFNRKISILNRQLVRKQTELRNSNTVKDKLFSILGHDLRAPLTRVIGLLNVLSLQQKTPDEAEIIEKLRHQSVNTLDTLDNLLMWGQSQLKGLRLNQQMIPVRERIKKTVSLASDYAGQKNVTIIHNTPADLQVYADAAHFDFVIRNLLSNAIKFSHSDRTVVLNAFPSGDELIFSIQDSGIGIARELQDQIFTSANESIKGTWEEKGTGIGLMLCREYITENGGRIWVESEPGNGATFYFSLRCKPLAAPEAQSCEANTGVPEIASPVS
ncbi:MAG: tetratricopeptide repeat-containing sensor histidine kinase [Chryseosolibacter sp.]